MLLLCIAWRTAKYLKIKMVERQFWNFSFLTSRKTKKALLFSQYQILQKSPTAESKQNSYTYFYAIQFKLGRCILHLSFRWYETYAPLHQGLLQTKKGVWKKQIRPGTNNSCSKILASVAGWGSQRTMHASWPRTSQLQITSYSLSTEPHSVHCFYWGPFHSQEISALQGKILFSRVIDQRCVKFFSSEKSLTFSTECVSVLNVRYDCWNCT